METRKNRFDLHFILYTGMMAAVCFAATYIRVAFSATSATSPFIHLGTAAAFLGAVLFGGLSGGLASGIGSFLFDLLNGYGIFSAVTSLVVKFLAAFVVGKIAWSGGRKGEKQSVNLLAFIAGGAVNLIGYCLYSFIVTLLTFIPNITHAGITAAFGAAGLMAVNSLLTTLVGIIFALLFNVQIRNAMKKAKLL